LEVRARVGHYSWFCHDSMHYLLSVLLGGFHDFVDPGQHSDVLKLG